MLATAGIILVIILFGCLMKPLKHQPTDSTDPSDPREKVATYRDIYFHKIRAFLVQEIGNATNEEKETLSLVNGNDCSVENAPVSIFHLFDILIS